MKLRNKGDNKEMLFYKFRKMLPVFFSFVITLFFLNGCGEEKEEAKSIEQIHKEEGVPVEVEVVKTKVFEKHLSFFSKITGVKEATKGAMIGGKIIKINAKPGTFVKEDFVVVEFATDNPASMYEQTKTAYENSKKTYERMKALLAAGETSQSNFEGAEAQYLVNKRNYEIQKQLIYIDAPFDGIITDVKVKEGDNVKSETSLFTIAQLHKVRTKVWISEKEINQIKTGMTATIEFGGKTYKGRVVEVSLSADPYKQAFYAEVEFDNSSREIKTGVVVETKILTYENPNAIVLPRNLVKSDEKGMFLFVEKDSQAQKKYVTNGMDSGLDYEVKTGLEVGEKLIVSGTARLENGTKVKVIK